MKRNIVERLQATIAELVELNKDKTEFMDVLSSLWDVYRKPATGEDPRYRTLGEEIEKHFVVNDDWSFSKLFVSILQYDQLDEKYYQFLEALINMTTPLSGEIISKIKDVIKKERYYVSDDNGAYTITNIPITNGEHHKSPYPIFVCNAVTQKEWGCLKQDVQWPEQNNCLVLAFNDGWNDFNCRTWYVLYYVTEHGAHLRMGDVKIMHDEDCVTPNKLPCSFNVLDSTFCSVGQSVGYYKQMRDTFGENAYDILIALRDCAISTKTLKKYEKHTCFINSLIRTNDAERALRLGKFCLQGRDLDNAFSFDYCFKKDYDGIGAVSAVFPFHFKYGCPSFKRAFALIGENGVGKTTLLNDMVEAILKQDRQRFDGTIPIISQLLLVSYSPFDKYQTAPKDGLLGYQYRGLLAEDGRLLSPDEQVYKLMADVSELIRRDGFIGVDRWQGYMAPIFARNEPLELFTQDDKYEVIEEAFREWYKHLSSGEALFVNTISALLAYIRFDSFVILDEPEQHLHPRAISELIRTILMIATKFESYVIIATHSPMVIREIVSDNVLTMSRVGASLNVAKICVESFGEDVSVLTDVVFRDCQDVKQYEKTIENLINMDGADYEKIVGQIQNDHNKLGLNLRLLIRDMVEKKKEENHEAPQL